MRITFLGTRGEVEERERTHRYQTGLLVEGKEAKILLDCGEERFLAEKPDAIFLTHAHPDHVKGLKKGTDLPVYLTRETEEGIRKFGLENRTRLEPGKQTSLKEVKIIPYRVYHSLKAPAVLLKISEGDFTFIFAPDVLSIPDREKVLEGVDLYIGDGSSLKRNLVRRSDDKVIGHAAVKTQIGWLHKAGVQYAVFTHWGTEAIRLHGNTLKFRIRRFAGPALKAEVARDGMAIDSKDYLRLGAREAEILEAVLPYKPKIEKKIDLIRTRDDWRIFGGWYAQLKEKGKFKYSKDEILNKFLIPCLKELIRDGSTEFHPENWKKWPREIYREAFDKVVKKFRYLVKPHGTMIWEGKKTATVHARRFIQGAFFSIVEGDKEFGFARFEAGRKIDLKECGKLEGQHRVTDDERKDWWPEARVLYFYKLRTWVPCDKPRTVKVPRGIRTYGSRADLKYAERKRSIGEQTDMAVILMKYGELEAKGLGQDEIIKRIAKGFLPIGFDIDYWKERVRAVLRSVGVLKEAKHRKDQCMKCEKRPEFEVLWAEGMGRAWFCKKHFQEWAKEHMEKCKEEGFAVDIDAVKRVTNGIVGEKWGDNPNADLKGQLKKLVSEALVPSWQKQKVNSPTFAYMAVYGKEPDHWIPGRTGGPEKEWRKGIMIDEHLKKEWFDALNSIAGIEVRASCYDEETEVYTKKGFQYFRNVDPSSQVLTLNPKTQNLEWSKIVRQFEYPFEGKLLKFTSKSLDLSVTKDHNMVYSLNWVPDKIFFAKPSEMHKKALFLKKCKWPSQEKGKIKINSLEFDRKVFALFLGYYLSEGYIRTRYGKDRQEFHQVRITQKQGKKKEQIERDLEKLSLHISKEKLAVVIHNTRLGKYLLQFGKSAERFVPEEIKCSDSEIIRVFLDAFALGDGNIGSEHIWKGYRFAKRRVFVTSSKRLADDIGELLLKIGRWPHYHLKRVKGKFQKFSNGTYRINRDVWTITDTRAKFVWKYKKIWQPYSGKVYDIQAEKNHILLVRRNGRVVWSGNCEGHSPERVSYIVFRFRDEKNDSRAEKLAGKLNAEDGIFSLSDIGTEGRPRICVAGKTYYGQADWEGWWENLAEKVERCIVEILREGFAAEIFDPKDYEPSKLKGLSDEELLKKREVLIKFFEQRGAKSGDELVINAYRFVKEEIGRRGLKVEFAPKLDELTASLKERALDKYLLERAERIKKLGPIVWKPGFISLTGSALFAERRAPNDLDTVFRDREVNPALLLKVDRIFEKYFGVPAHPIPEPFGPNWRHLPLWDLALVPTKEFQIIEINEPGFMEEFYESVCLTEEVPRAAGKELRKQAADSIGEDEIKMNRFFLGLKPTRPAFPEERMTLESLLKFFKPEDFPVYVEKKYD